MNFAWYALWFLVAVSLLVTVHEYGHFWAARKLGFKVLRFSVGFGRPLLTRVAGADRTEYVLAAIPLGGYVKLLDEREGPVAMAELSRSFTRRPPWQRIAVLLAGPAFNIIFAIIVLWGMLWAAGSPEARAVIGEVAPQSLAAGAGLRADDEVLSVNGDAIDGRGDFVLALIEAMSSDGEAAMTVRGHDGRERTANLRVADPAVRHALTEPDRMFTGLGFRFWEPPAPPVLGLVEPGGPAARAGLMAGDRILAVNGEPVKLFGDLAAMIHARPAENIAVRYSRNGAELTVRLVTDVVLNEGRREGRIRVAPAAAQLPANMIVRKEYGPFAALARATIDAWQMTALQARMFWRMLQGQVSLKNLSGPLSIAEFAGESARSGLTGFLGFLVLISLSLGFLNLLPIPILDGGQIVLQLAELVKGAPLSERAQLVGQQIGMALLLLLMGVALFNDVARQLG